MFYRIIFSLSLYEIFANILEYLSTLLFPTRNEWRCMLISGILLKRIPHDQLLKIIQTCLNSYKHGLKSFYQTGVPFPFYQENISHKETSIILIL